jgi:hypothetical protein
MRQPPWMFQPGHSWYRTRSQLHAIEVACSKRFLFLAYNRKIILIFSHFWDRPVPIFSDMRFSYIALVQDKKITCILPTNAAHDNWKNVKTIYRFHELVFYIWDNHLECFNRDTRDIELEASCSQIPYEQKTILCRVFTRRDNETGRVHGPWLSIMVSQLFTYQRRIQGGGKMSNTDPTINRGWTQVLTKGK